MLLVPVLLALILLESGKPAPVAAQEESIDVDLLVEQVFEMLTPHERVGQLFMVSFNGVDVKSDTEIAELIQEYRVGGVLVSAKNKNFVNSSTTPSQVLRLTNGLQTLALGEPDFSILDRQAELAKLPVTSTDAITNSPTITTAHTALPLFIAVNHEGDGYPHTEIREGLTDIPNQMGIGATWEPENARLVGQIVGQELSLLGINMLLGPSLDVLDNPRPERDGSLGTRTFGGSPYWVGEMGQAYIRGIHEGSDHQILTVAKHFPGFGSSDREINQGVPTILKSLDDLRRKELGPFFEVTDVNPDDPDPSGITDGLMTAHVRYQGLQGNVPISMDARNLPAILALKEFAAWRDSGGLLVSAPLGMPAALEGTAAQDNFPARRLAWDALWAGNDVLLASDFAFEDNPADEMANIKNAMVFFQEKYETDANFRSAVDKAVRRILKAKVKVYGEGLLESQTRKSPEILELLSKTAKSIDLDKIAQAGVTLITSATTRGLAPLTGPPQPDDKILVFTDDRVAKDCFDCPAFVLMQTDALEEIILRLFGPDATGQVLPENITSLSFSRLKEILEEGDRSTPASPTSPSSIPFPSPTPSANSPTKKEATETLIEEADWIVFAMLNVDTRAYPQSDAVKVMLRNRYDMVRNKNLVVFAFNAPYFLDETEISQLTAYYVFYNKGQTYFEASARLLFQQFKPSGALPVGIPGVNPLDLSPDPEQTIQLKPIQIIDTKDNVIPLDGQSNSLTTLDLDVGEGVLFRTSVIMDRNGNPVPDGTLVNFFRAYPKEGLWLEPLTESTTNGVAEIRIVKERESPLQVTASSNLAVQAVPFNIGPGIIDTPTPTLTPTATDTPTASPTPIATVTPQSSPTVIVPVTTPEPPLLTDQSNALRPVNVADLIYSLLAMTVIGGIAFALGEDRFSLEERIRPALMAVAIGLVGYISYIIVAMAVPRTGYIGLLIASGAANHWVAPLVSLLFAITGMIAWYLKPGRIFWSNAK